MRYAVRDRLVLYGQLISSSHRELGLYLSHFVFIVLFCSLLHGSDSLLLMAKGCDVFLLIPISFYVISAVHHVTIVIISNSTIL